MKHDKARKNLIDAYVARLLPPVRTLVEIRKDQLAVWIRQAIELNRSPV